MSGQPYATRHIKRVRATREEMEHRYEVLLELAEEHAPATVRNIYYRAVVADLVEKSERGYLKVQRALVDLRRRDILPYEWIADNTRWMRKPTSYGSLPEALEETARVYRRDLWRGTGQRVEVWTESDSIAGVVYDVTADWDVPLLPVKGFSSITFTYTAAMIANLAQVPLTVYYIGDHDPAGLEIERALRRDLKTHLQVPLNFTRIGVTWDQVEHLDLPGTTPKKGYGFPLAVEAEALPPNDLREILKAAIVDHVDERHLRIVETAEQSEREILNRICSWVAA